MPGYQTRSNWSKEVSAARGDPELVRQKRSISMKNPTTFDSSCRTCNGPVPAGTDRVRFDPQAKEIQCPSCYAEFCAQTGARNPQRRPSHPFISR